MLNSPFIPNVPPNTSDSLSNMQNSVNTINSSFSSINSRLTTLEKNVNADVLKATESLEYLSKSISDSTVQIPLTKDSSSYSKIIVKILAFTVKAANDETPIPAQNVTVIKNNSAGFIFGVTKTGSGARELIVWGDRTVSYSAAKSSFLVTYLNSQLIVAVNAAQQGSLMIMTGVVTVEYY